MEVDTIQQPEQQVVEIPETTKQVFAVPLSIQRYFFIAEFIEAHPDIKTLTDLGSGNCRLSIYTKTIPTLEQCNFIDSDLYVVNDEIDIYLRPTLHDMMFGRQNSSLPMQLNVFHGDIKFPDDRLKADCITMIEVIEHMPIAEHQQCLKTIFGYYQPKYVIITTPNREFNHFIFPNEYHTRYRHYDHKFEWTRLEFYEWCMDICERYSYSCSIEGIGFLESCLNLGPGTQVAIFERKKVIPQFETDLACLDVLLNKLNVKNEASYMSPQFNSQIWSFVVPGMISKIVHEEEYDWSKIIAEDNDDILIESCDSIE